VLKNGLETAPSAITFCPSDWSASVSPTATPRPNYFFTIVL
jgi:hypothetical protein